MMSSWDEDETAASAAEAATTDIDFELGGFEPLGQRHFDRGRARQQVNIIGAAAFFTVKMMMLPHVRAVTGGFAILVHLSHQPAIDQRIETVVNGGHRNLGHPVLGDPVYGPGLLRFPGHATLEQAINAFPRQALHAEHIRFQHPDNEQWLDFTAPLPADMATLLASLHRDRVHPGGRIAP